MMPDLSSMNGMEKLRRLEPEWNTPLIVASIAISFLGAFTSTQLMCHARMSLHFSSVLTWSLAGSVIFGFCSVWALHEVAMLAYELDLPIGVDAPLTVVSSLLAVLFTFVALSNDLLWDRWQTRHYRHHRSRSQSNQNRPQTYSLTRRRSSRSQSTTPLLDTENPDALGEEAAEVELEDDYFSQTPLVQTNGEAEGAMVDGYPESGPPTPSFAANPQELMAFAHTISRTSAESLTSNGSVKPLPKIANGLASQVVEEVSPDTASEQTHTSTDYLRRSSSAGYSSVGLSSALGMIYHKSGDPARDAFTATAMLLYAGCTKRNVGKGFLWSLAITGMHYVGIKGLKVPHGFVTFHPWLVLLSALTSWIVCTVGTILMSHMETAIGQQILFSVIAAVGVAAMHFSGMAATTFWSTAPPSVNKGYPPALANAVVAVAFITCIAANVLLAHSATVSRNKLAEIVWTRKELWKTIALKENAEAAARARSDFIASASHEIRTPLHHLQGYSDLLAQTDLTDEGRDLLISIQRATKTLSLITNNVLDWSKFEREPDGAYRPTALDIRGVCESIVVLLPNIDEDSRVELFVVVAPEVPKTLFLDETFIHRILMNLLSNALKFTRMGYISLAIEMQKDSLVATVTDTGCGLEPSFIPEMWTPFKQGEVRGSARGTGLGLSIIKTLLKRMKGKIDVESKYMHAEGIGPNKSGTTFTVTIPMPSTMARPIVSNHDHKRENACNSFSATLADLNLKTPASNDRPKVAILATGSEKSLKGLRTCWDIFGFDVEDTSQTDDLALADYKYTLATLDFLNANPDQFEALMRNTKRLVLVPYDTHDSLEGLPGILSAPNFVMLPKPLIWHTFEKRMTMKSKQRRDAVPTQALRFAAEVEVMNLENKTNSMTPPPKDIRTILLVEDNPINQKLGTRMLKAFSYNVLTASDGQEAIDTLLRTDDSLIDLILMDQSMPRKDGVTATREIRELEAAGTLRRRPIIAVTAVVNSESQQYFKEAGADDFLAKPLSLQRLGETLAGYLPA